MQGHTDSNPHRDLERKDRFAILPDESQCGTRFRSSLLTNETRESEPFAEKSRVMPKAPPMNGSRTVRHHRGRTVSPHRSSLAETPRAAPRYFRFVAAIACPYRGCEVSPESGLNMCLAFETPMIVHSTFCLSRTEPRWGFTSVLRPDTGQGDVPTR